MDIKSDKFKSEVNKWSVLLFVMAILLTFVTFIFTGTSATAGAGAFGILRDTLGGESLRDSIDVIVDSDGPEMRAEFDFNHIVLSKHICDEGKITEATVFPHGTVLTISANDPGGVKAIFYSIDRAYERRYIAPVRLTAKGNHTVKFRSIDLLDNESESVRISFIVVE